MRPTASGTGGLDRMYRQNVSEAGLRSDNCMVVMKETHIVLQRWELSVQESDEIAAEYDLGPRVVFDCRFFPPQEPRHPPESDTQQ